jgi:hypothetical protein
LFRTNAFLAAHSQAVFLLQAIEWLALNATDRKDAGGSAIPLFTLVSRARNIEITAIWAALFHL